MTEHPEVRANSVMRKVLPFTSAAVIIALLYVGYIFYSRRQEEKDAEQQATQKQAEEAHKVSEAYGGNELKILTFYATEGPIRRGESTQLCYSVANAKTLNIEPDIHEVPVSYSNCVKIAPKKDTAYTLTATDSNGKSEQAILTLKVQ